MTDHRILIVDDEVFIRTMLTRMIEPLQHQVLEAGDGEEALQLLRTNAVDLVISDLRMPRMDGFALLRTLREEGFDCAFIILTGYGDLPQALDAREQYNIANFLVKPIHNIDQFLFDVESALKRRELELENSRLLARLRDVNAELEDKVRERTSELLRKNEELDRLSRFRADVLRVLGHELRTPLAILAGYQPLLGEAEPETAREIAGLMGSSLQHLNDIVEKALLLLRGGARTDFPFDVQPVEPTALWREVVERLRPFVERRRMRIVLPEPESPAPDCRWDREKIEEVVEELVINAVRASPDGATVEVRVEADAGWMEICVVDMGRGVPAEQTERIFEPFVTLGDATHHHSGLMDQGAEGVGLGLSTARMWAALHGGTLTAHANGDHPGMTLRLRLPRRVGTPAHPTPPSA